LRLHSLSFLNSLRPSADKQPECFPPHLSRICALGLNDCSLRSHQSATTLQIATCATHLLECLCVESAQPRKSRHAQPLMPQRDDAISCSRPVHEVCALCSAVLQTPSIHHFHTRDGSRNDLIHLTLRRTQRRGEQTQTRDRPHRAARLPTKAGHTTRRSLLTTHEAQAAEARLRRS
jgi:hypothetical protein